MARQRNTEANLNALIYTHTYIHTYIHRRDEERVSEIARQRITEASLNESHTAIQILETENKRLITEVQVQNACVYL